MEQLIPQAWFAGQNTVALFAVAAGAMFALVKGADLLVDGASGLAFRLGIPKIIVGATVVSLGTTSPEAAVSVMAAWADKPGLALGNAVGSIIADTGLIFGLSCLITVLPADRFVLTRQGWVQFGAAALLALLCYGLWLDAPEQATLGLGVGLLLLGLLAAYLVISVRWSRRHPVGEPFQLPDDVTEVTMKTGVVEQEARSHTTAWTLALLVVGLLVVLFSSRVLVCSMSEVAVRWGVPEVVIAATLVAFGTSLPELATAMTSIRKGHPELLVGNVIGADILNVLFVIGASAVAAPLPIIEQGARHPALFLWLHLPTMLVILVLFRLFIFSAVRKGVFSRMMGAPLVLIYIAYLVLQFAVSVG